MPDTAEKSAEWMLLRGAPGPPAELLELRAGPLTMLFDPEIAFLRAVRLGHREVLRGVYAAVRDRNWGTVTPRVTDLRVERGAASFRIRFDVECRQGGIDFGWRGEVTGGEEGTVIYRMVGEARSTFLTNRTGFCVLHPDTCAGSACTVEHVDGSREESAFPDLISPHQPFRGIRGITHEAAPGVRVEVRTTGDTFEMEDQRNWTDASFKTYCRPLELPYPYELAAGARVEQSVTLTLGGTVPALAAEGGRQKITLHRLDAPPVPLPPIGLGMAGEPDLTPREVERLRALRPAHLRVDLKPSDPAAWELVDTAVRLAEELDAALEVALFLPEKPHALLARLAGHRGLESVREVRWLLFPAAGKATTDREVARARAALPFGSFVGGTDAYFTELNRERPSAHGLDGICYSLNPQVHAFDDRSLAETLGTQGATVRSARALYPGKPIHISPVTLRPRGNPDATAPAEETPVELPASVDPRQPSLFAAGWTLGSIKHLAEAGAGTLTLYETAGWRGVQEREAVSALPERLLSTPGGVFPLYHVLADLAELRGGEVLPMGSSDPLRVEALLLRCRARHALLLANLTPEPQQVTWPSFAEEAEVRLRMLDRAAADEAIMTPEAFRRRGAVLPAAGRAFTLDLPPYAVARVSWGGTV